MHGAGRWNAVGFWIMRRVRRSVLAAMARKLRIRMTFEPSRLGRQHLEKAYEAVVPVVKRALRRPSEEDESSASTVIRTDSKKRSTA